MTTTLTMTEPKTESLYAQFRSAEQAAPAERDSRFQAVLFHPDSRQKLQAACQAVLRKWPDPQQHAADVMQEAAIIVWHKIQEDRIVCHVTTDDQFRGWLWKLWRHACLHAWRRIRRAQARAPRTNCDQSMAAATREPAPARQRADNWPAVLKAIMALSNEGLRHALIDWACGLNGQESAIRRGVSKATISKRRSAGVALLRTRLEELHGAADDAA